MLLGGATAALGLIEAVSATLCSPRAPPAAPGCIPLAGLSLYGIALLVTAPVVGSAAAALGFVLYRRAKTR